MMELYSKSQRSSDFASARWEIFSSGEKADWRQCFADDVCGHGAEPAIGIWIFGRLEEDKKKKTNETHSCGGKQQNQQVPGLVFVLFRIFFGTDDGHGQFCGAENVSFPTQNCIELPLSRRY